MLLDFLNDCKVCIPEEKHDFDTVKRALKDKAYINYLPAVWDDLYPVHIIDMIAGKHNFTNVYLCPVGASDYFGLHHFNEILNDFYENDIIKSSPLYYGAELEEAILLKTTTIHTEREFKIAGFSPNVIYIRISTHRGNKAHLFLIADTPENSFKEIIEDFEVKIHVTIENHKGLGSYFNGFELYRLFAESDKRYLLPKYWFCGKYAWPINMSLNSIYKLSKCEIFEVPDWTKYPKINLTRKAMMKMTNKRRVVLKLSGEALAGEHKTGLSEKKLLEVANEIKKLVDNNVQVAIVVGGGNFWRGKNGTNMDKTKSDHIGMLATTMNGIAIATAIESVGLEAMVQSSIDMSPIAKIFIKDDALKALERGTVVILTGGTGNPFFTTDTATILRALELEADTVLLAKNIDAVYSADPNQDKNAIRYTNISYAELIEQKLKVIDTTAVALAQENKVVCHLFSLSEPSNISKILFGTKQIGTVIM